MPHCIHISVKTVVNAKGSTGTSVTVNNNYIQNPFIGFRMCARPFLYLPLHDWERGQAHHLCLMMLQAELCEHRLRQQVLVFLDAVYWAILQTKRLECIFVSRWFEKKMKNYLVILYYGIIIWFPIFSNGLFCVSPLIVPGIDQIVFSVFTSYLSLFILLSPGSWTISSSLSHKSSYSKALVIL